MIEWKPSLSVGVYEIDSQHQELFRRASLFVEGVASRSRADTGMLLSFLRLYAVGHFGAEEEWMRRTSYPGFEAHQRQHDHFLRDLLALSEQNERLEGPALQPERVARWLERWLVGHVSRTDMDLALHLRTCEVPVDVLREARA